MAMYPAGPSRQSAQNAYDELFRKIATATPDDYEAIVEYIKSTSKYTVICDNAHNGPLHIAIRHRKWHLLSLLLTMKELPVNKPNRSGDTPLHMCLKHNIGIQFLEKLIAAGADVNASNVEGKTPLHLAMKFDHRYALLLIQHGALENIDAVDSSGHTPLHYAVIEGNFDNVSLLLYYNADSNIENSAGRTPFLLTNFEPGNSCIIQEVLLEYDNVFLLGEEDYRLDVFCNNRIYHLLHDCIHSKNLEMFKIAWSRTSPDIIELMLEISPNVYPNAPFDFIDFMLSSDKLDLTKSPDFYPSVNEIWESTAGEDTDKRISMVVDTTYLILGFGGTLSMGDVQFLHRYQHYEIVKELIRVLLFMDLEMDSNRVFHDFPEVLQILPYIMCNIHDKFETIIDRYMSQFSTWIVHISIGVPELEENIQQYLEFCSYDKFFQFYRSLLPSSFGFDLKISETCVPSLLELSRNRAKDRICEKYRVKNACQFYTIVESLPMIPRKVKDMIAFRTPIYGKAGCRIIEGEYKRILYRHQYILLT